MCGRVNIEHLRRTPCAQIAAKVPTDGDVCVSCSKKTGHAAVVPSNVDAGTAAWIGSLRKQFHRMHAQVAEETIVMLASRLAEVGPPESAAAREVFDQIQGLLLKPLFTRRKHGLRNTRTTVTIPHLQDALDKLPPNTAALRQIASTMRCWRSVTQRDTANDKFRSDHVVDTILQIPTPEPYIRHLLARGLPHLAAMFHPNTLARAKKEPTLRGVFAGSATYMERTASQLNIVTD